jgi:phosphoenolpyruvate carboxykinase (GTP)
MRALKWIVDRVHVRRCGVESHMGIMLRHQDTHWKGTEYGPKPFYGRMCVEREAGSKEVREEEDFFDLFFDRLPKEFTHHRKLFESRVYRPPKVRDMA